MSGGRVLTLMQLANKWGWSRSKLHRLVDAKRIPHLRIGPRRDVHFEEDAVERWLAEQRVGEGAPRRAPVADESREAMCRELGIELEHEFT